MLYDLLIKTLIINALIVSSSIKQAKKNEHEKLVRNNRTTLYSFRVKLESELGVRVKN